MTKALRIPTQSPLKAIRRFCVECCGNSVDSIRFCMNTDCCLWYLRFGSRPQTLMRKTKEYALLLDKENFGKGCLFDPEIDEISSLRKKLSQHSEKNPFTPHCRRHFSSQNQRTQLGEGGGQG